LSATTASWCVPAMVERLRERSESVAVFFVVEVLGDRVDDEQLERRARAGFGFGGEDRGGEHVGEDVEERGDIELLRQRWQSANTDTLVNYFFKYFSHDFLYNTYVASIRAGLREQGLAER